MGYLVLMLCCNLNSLKSPFTELSIYLDLIEERKKIKCFPVVRLAEALGPDIFYICIISFMSTFH